MAFNPQEEAGNFGVPGVVNPPPPTLISDYDPYSGIDLTQAGLTYEFNTDEYFSLDNDKRPSLGLFFTKNNNPSENDFSENITGDSTLLFQQIDKTNLIRNHDAKYIKTFDYFQSTLGEGNEFYAFRPTGNWSYLSMDGVGYQLTNQSIETYNDGDGNPLGEEYVKYWVQDDDFLTQNIIVEEQAIVTDEVTFQYPNPFELIPDVLSAVGITNPLQNDYYSEWFSYGVTGNTDTIPAGTEINDIFLIINGEGGHAEAAEVGDVICRQAGYDRVKIIEPDPNNPGLETPKVEPSYWVGSDPLMTIQPRVTYFPTTGGTELNNLGDDYRFTLYRYDMTDEIPSAPPPYTLSELTCENITITPPQVNYIENRESSGQYGYAGYYPYTTVDNPNVGGNSILNYDLNWAKWVMDDKCYSWSQCLKFKATDGWDNIGEFLNTNVGSIQVGNIGSLEACGFTWEVASEDSQLYWSSTGDDTCSSAEEVCAGFNHPPDIGLLGNLQDGVHYDVLSNNNSFRCVNPVNYMNDWFVDAEIPNIHHCNSIDNVGGNNYVTSKDDTICKGLHRYCVDSGLMIEEMGGLGLGLENLGLSDGDTITGNYYQCVSHIQAFNTGVAGYEDEVLTLGLADNNEYRTINQAQKIYDPNDGDTLLNPYSSLEVSFWMKTDSTDPYYNSSNPPHVEAAIVKSFTDDDTINPTSTPAFTTTPLIDYEEIKENYTKNVKKFYETSNEAGVTTSGNFTLSGTSDFEGAPVVIVKKIEIRGMFGRGNQTSDSALNNVTIGGYNFGTLDNNSDAWNFTTEFEGNQILPTIGASNDGSTQIPYSIAVGTTLYGDADDTSYTDSEGDTIYNENTFELKVTFEHINFNILEEQTFQGSTQFLYQEGKYNSLTNQNNTFLSPFGSMNRFANSQPDIWEKFSFKTNLTFFHTVKNDLEQVLPLYFLIQSSSDSEGKGFRGTVYLDNFEVKESYDFIPDVDVRSKKGPNDYGTADLTEYHDKQLHPQQYKDSQAPLEAQFYFYPRYALDNFFDTNAPIIYNDFRQGMFYLYDVDWGDGSPNEFINNPLELGENITVNHTYEQSGIFEITGTVIRMKPDKDYTPSGIIHNKRFVLRIMINEGVDEDFEYFGSEDGFTYIPYKDTTAVIGGYSKQSIYYKSIKRQLGILSDDFIVGSPFKSEGDRLKTEIALDKMDSSYSNDFTLLNEFKKPRYFPRPVATSYFDNENDLGWEDYESGTVTYEDGFLKMTSDGSEKWLGKMANKITLEHGKTYQINAEIYIPSDWDGGLIRIEDGGAFGKWDPDGDGVEEQIPETFDIVSDLSIRDRFQPVRTTLEIPEQAELGYNNDLNGRFYVRVLGSYPSSGKSIYLDNFIIQELSQATDPNAKIYSGIKSLSDEMGESIGDADLTNIRYFNKPKQMAEMLGFYLDDNIEEDSFTFDNFFKPEFFEPNLDSLQIDSEESYGVLNIQLFSNYADYYVGQGFVGTLSGDENIGYQSVDIKNLTQGDSAQRLKFKNPILNETIVLESQQTITIFIPSVDYLEAPYLPNNPRYWKNFIPNNYFNPSDNIINREGVFLDGTQYVNVHSNQDWIGTNSQYGNTYYYPVLPKYGADGRFLNGVLPQLDGRDKIPFPLEAPITNENYEDGDLKISIKNESTENNVFDDISGNNNYGFSYIDFRPNFDKETLKPNKTKNIPLVKTSTRNGAF